MVSFAAPPLTRFSRAQAEFDFSKTRCGGLTTSACQSRGAPAESHAVIAYVQIKSDMIVAIVVQNKPNMPQEHDPSQDATAAPAVVERLPNFVFHATPYWTVTQIHEAFTQLHYTKMSNFVPGKGKKNAAKATTLTHVNANSLGGVHTFYDHVAAVISNSSPSFLEAQPPKTISGDTLRKLFEKKLAYRVTQRLSWRKGPNAFHRTGDGDFPLADENHPSLAHLPSDRERFQTAYACTQIDDILDSHLESVSKEEIAHRERAAQHISSALSGAGSANGAPESSGSGSALEHLDASALSIVVAQPNQHAFGLPMRPAAAEGSVSSAAVVIRSGHAGSASNKRAKPDPNATTVHKVVAFGDSVTSLGAAMLERFKRPPQPSPEEEAAMIALKWGTAAKSVIEVVSSAAVNFAKEWKKTPEVLPPKITQLSKMNPAQLLNSIKSIGVTFTKYPALDTNIIGCGLDGEMLSKMPDTDIKEFLVQDCSVNAVHANILIAKLACWRDGLP